MDEPRSDGEKVALPESVFEEFQTELEGRFWGGVGNPRIQASIC
jgi:hypothetical protein